MPPPRPRARPALPDDLIEEVLLRVPPDDPASLVRTALACRRWCGLVADWAFRRRRLEFHGATPPMLGFLCDAFWDGKNSTTRFVPSSSCRQPRADHRGLWLFDARHGRVLLHDNAYRKLVVWDPITDQRVELPSVPCFLPHGGCMKATVLCAATGSCDHTDCHRGPFIVVLVGTEDDKIVLDEKDDSFSSEDHDIYDDPMDAWCRRVPKDMFSCIYSSESGAWSKPTYDDHPGENVDWDRSALADNALFFVIRSYDRILKYDFSRQQMSVIRLPFVRGSTIFTRFAPIQLTTLEDGRFGFTRVEKSTEVCLWSMGEGDDVKGWTLCKVIDLKDLFPLVDSLDLKYSLVGIAESVCVAFVAVKEGLYTVDMKSGLIKKVSEGCSICYVVPYINFCNPALEAPSRDEEQIKGWKSQVARVGVSSA